MADTNLSDDMLKLVSYNIVCIQRGNEHVVACNCCKIFSDNMTDCDFDAWVIADYCNHRDRDRCDPCYRDHDLPCDSRYLRVTYQVLGRWAKQDLHYEEKQLESLDHISAAILACCEKDPKTLAALAKVEEEKKKK